MLLYGAGGHAKVVKSCLEQSNIQVLGIFDDDPLVTYFQSIPVLGSYIESVHKKSKLIITIGENSIRMKISKKIFHPFGIAIHPTAIIDRLSSIGKGSVVFHNSTIQRNTKIGDHVIINTSSSIDHDCVIGNFAHIAPGSILCGDIKVGEGTLIGAGSVIKPGIEIGKWCNIGLGSVIINNIPDYSTVVGNPGRIIRTNHR